MAIIQTTSSIWTVIFRHKRAGTTTSIVPPGRIGPPNPPTLGWVFYEFGSPNSTQGLPISRQFISAANSAVTFQFQPYIGNNVVLNGGTLTLTTQTAYTSLAFLTSSQGPNGQSFQVVLTFSDGSTTALTRNDLDWTAPPPSNTAITNVGVVLDNSSWTGFYTAAQSMFEHDYTLSVADQMIALDSISFSITAGNCEMLFAVSGDATMPAAPETVVLSPDIVNGGNSSMGTVTLTNAPIVSTAVTVTSSNTAAEVIRKAPYAARRRSSHPGPHALPSDIPRCRRADPGRAHAAAHQPCGTASCPVREV